MTQELNELDRGLDELDDLLDHQITEENNYVEYEEFDGGGDHYEEEEQEERYDTYGDGDYGYEDLM